MPIAKQLQHRRMQNHSDRSGIYLAEATDQGDREKRRRERERARERKVGSHAGDVQDSEGQLALS